MPLVIAVMTVLLAAPALASQPASFQEIEESLTCQCGCGLTVQACNHLQCPSAIPLRQEIRAQMALGLDKESILDHFETKYGEKILSSPTTRGFNLTAWIMPFAMVALGGVVVVFTLLRWRRSTAGEEPAAAAQPGDDPQLAEHRKLLERELAEFDG